LAAFVIIALLVIIGLQGFIVLALRDLHQTLLALIARLGDRERE
jgi:hypothetical protein